MREKPCQRALSGCLKSIMPSRVDLASARASKAILGSVPPWVSFLLAVDWSSHCTQRRRSLQTRTMRRRACRISATVTSELWEEGSSRQCSCLVLCRNSGLCYLKAEKASRTSFTAAPKLQRSVTGARAKHRSRNHSSRNINRQEIWDSAIQTPCPLFCISL
jgi:hypothetical protein